MCADKKVDERWRCHNERKGVGSGRNRRRRAADTQSEYKEPGVVKLVLCPSASNLTDEGVVSCYAQALSDCSSS